MTGENPALAYLISWTYLGSELNDTIQFTVLNAPNVKANGASTTNDTDINNNCASCQPGHAVNTSTAPMGSTVFFNGGTNIPAFTLTDISGSGGTVTNGGDNPAPVLFGANLIFSYADLIGGNFVLTDQPTGFVVFAFNDNGFGDDNHDDFVGAMSFAFCGDCGNLLQNTPLPAAFPLFATGLGALGLLCWRRKRKTQASV